MLAVFERFVPRNQRVEHQFVLWLGGKDTLTFSEDGFQDIKGRLGAELTESVARTLQPKILAALQRGESYVFPGWGNAHFTEFRPEGVGGADGMIPWAELAGVDVQDGNIVIQGRQSLVRSWTDTGNATLLVAMLRTVVANRQALSAPPTSNAGQ